MEEWDDVVGTGYVIDSFAIRKADVASAHDTAARLAREFNCKPDEFDHSGWRSAYAHTGHHEWKLLFDAFRGHLMDWGVVVGIHQSEMISLISAAVEATKAEDLYAEPIDETKPTIETQISCAPPLTTSDRDLADDRVGVAIALVFGDFLWPLVGTAVDIAWKAASIVGLDVAAAPERYGLPRKAPVPVKRASGAERDRLTRSAADAVRKYLKDVLRDPAVVRRVGRQVEAERDHRAYCMRERLVHSEEFMSMQRNARYARARERVIAEVIAPMQGGCSAANFQRIMDAGKAVHRRVVPNVPFCERWPQAPEPSRK